MVQATKPLRASAPAFATAAMPAAVLAVAAACWVVAVREMSGMDMGVATELGSLQFFVATWVSMMAAMMLPGALPALIRFARAGRSVLAVPQFAVSYLTVWTVVGLVAYALYHPHGTAIAGALTVAAGLYELTPLKRACRLRCRQNVGSGSWFGLYCIGSSIGLMLVLLAVGAMSVTWMGVVAALVAAQKLLPPRPVLDVPLALSIVGLGIAIAAAPSSIPGIT
jgi:predicted metal-binding membrane protein